MKNGLLIIVAVFMISVTMNSCQKSHASIDEAEKSQDGFNDPQNSDYTLVQIDLVMMGSLDDMQTQMIQTAAEAAIMTLEQEGTPAVTHRIVIGSKVIYPRGGEPGH